MILLDTDHVSILTNRKAAGHFALVSRLESAEGAVGLPVICVEEQFQGWLAKIHRSRNVYQEIPGYEQLINFVRFLADWDIVSFQAVAADAFHNLRKQKIRIGSQDLKIAAIALTHRALLLSANLRDFP